MRYALRFELADGTLDEPYHTMARKADAIRAAKVAAKSVRDPADIVRVWVDDTTQAIGLASFNTGAQ